MLNVVVLVSGGGTNLQAIIDAQKQDYEIFYNQEIISFLLSILICSCKVLIFYEIILRIYEMMYLI